MNKPQRSRPLSYRTVWISDVHLGFRGCSAEHLLDFLHSVDCKFLYLVGDIIDLWWMAQRRAQWGSAQNRVVEALHALRRAGRASEVEAVVQVARDEVAAARRDGMQPPIVDLLEAELAQGEPGRARRLYSEALAVAHSQGAPGLIERAERGLNVS